MILPESTCWSVSMTITEKRNPNDSEDKWNRPKLVPLVCKFYERKGRFLGETTVVERHLGGGSSKKPPHPVRKCPDKESPIRIIRRSYKINPVTLTSHGVSGTVPHEIFSLIIRINTITCKYTGFRKYIVTLLSGIPVSMIKPIANEHFDLVK